MDQLRLKPAVTAEETKLFAREVQTAFQDAYEALFGPCESVILPCEDIRESFETPGATAWMAFDGGQRAGGALVVADPVTQSGSLHLLYVKKESRNAGLGQRIWQAVEKMYPDITLWETHTPYYDQRNIHFYVNRCGFHIVEFFNPRHPDPHQAGETTGGLLPEDNLFFRFEKKTKGN